MVRSWTFGICESCLKNLHEKVKMEKIVMISDEGKKEEVWCCPVCGATKKL
ncbi:MAG: hypothetical protein QW040_01150 [Candidatus Aenigmatarchaeota archaeon]